jgi:hypothetical protein
VLLVILRNLTSTSDQLSLAPAAKSGLAIKMGFTDNVSGVTINRQKMGSDRKMVIVKKSHSFTILAFSKLNLNAGMDKPLIARLRIQKRVFFE